jgi:fluoride exporter
MPSILLVVFGGFFGAISRYFISSWAKKKFNASFPVGTITVNLVGSFFLGYFFAGSFEMIYSLLGVGFLGAFTTFSTMNVEAVQLFLKKKTIIAIVYLILTYFFGVLLAFIGFYIGY